MNVVYLPEAQQELQAVANYYETRQSGLGEAFLLAVERAEKMIKNTPYAWARLRGDIRRISLQRFPYGLIYSVQDDRIIILAVNHHRRHPDAWQSRLS